MNTHEHEQMPLNNDPSTEEWQVIANELQVDHEKGLDEREVSRRQKQYGMNVLREARKISAFEILANQFKSLVIVLLIVASALAFAFGEIIEGIAIAAVIFINAFIGFITEFKAVRSMEALRKLGNVTARVRLDGRVKEVPAQDLVPGDIVILEGGDIITADIRIIDASKLQADESMLTGESVPVSKSSKVLEEKAPLAERENMLFKGTSITRGSGEGIVVATGMNTELGKISELVEEAEDEITPLEKRLEQLGRKLIWITLSIAALVAVSGIVRGKDVLLMIETGIALAVASIPEGLPIVATIALARGMWRMAKRNALINRLSAVETLGATNVICTDKTGTLTENRMTVTLISLDSGDVEITSGNNGHKGKFSRNGKSVSPDEIKTLRTILEIGVLCNNASLQKKGPDNGNAVGDPLEIALLDAGYKAGIQRDNLIEKQPEAHEEAFDPDIKMMATYHKVADDKYRVAVKGAPEVVIQSCSRLMTDDGVEELRRDERKQWLSQNSNLAESGLRVLALAYKEVSSVDEKPYTDLILTGLMGLMDPPREDVKAAIQACHNAGIRIIMVTGDQPVTAQKVAEVVGMVEEKNKTIMKGNDLKDIESLSEIEREKLLGAEIFARVTPSQKLDLIDLHQKNNSVVAMTGDGVNDAPALKKADIGIAMGQRGTQVAREASDMILKDDAFNTIVAAIEQGRVIFNNIRKFVVYLISCNVSEVMIVFLASIVNAPLPILPLQILFLNFVTDVFPALALGVGEGDPHIMKIPPRDPREPIATRANWFEILGFGCVITITVLAAFAISLNVMKADTRQAVTISFLTLAFAQLWHVFNMREYNSRIFMNDIVRNPYVWGALILCIFLLLIAIYVPLFSKILRIQDPGLNGWLFIIGMSLIPLVVGQFALEIRNVLRPKE